MQMTAFFFVCFAEVRADFFWCCVAFAKCCAFCTEIDTPAVLQLWRAASRTKETLCLEMVYCTVTTVNIVVQATGRHSSSSMV